MPRESIQQPDLVSSKTVLNPPVDEEGANDSAVAGTPTNEKPSKATMLAGFFFGRPVRAGLTAAALVAIVFGPIALFVPGVGREEEKVLRFNETLHTPLADAAVKSVGVAIGSAVSGASAALAARFFGKTQSEAAKNDEAAPLIIGQPANA